MSKPEEFFQDLPDPEQKTYPGSTTVRRSARPKPPPEPQEALKWDRSPITRQVVLAGKKVTVEFFHIRALAEALGKESVTIRKWMLYRWLPEARFRDRDQILPDGKVRHGKRLWTRAQIEAIVAIAKEEGLLDTARPDVKGSKFTDRVKNYLRTEMERDNPSQ